MAKVEGIAQNMLISLNGLCNQSYRWLGFKFKTLIEDAMESADLTEIDFTCGTGLAKDGIRSRYGYITKMTCNDGLIAFYYTHIVAQGGHNDSSIVTYDDFMSGGKKFVVLQRIHDIICEISDVLDYLSKQNKEVTVTLSNGVKVICNVPSHVTQEENLVDYIKSQMEDYSKLLNEAVENRQYTYDDINGDKEALIKEKKMI